MKTSIILSLLLGVCAAFSPVHAQSTNDMVRVQVRTISKNKNKDIKGASVDTVTQNEMLEISLSGKPQSGDSRTVKWYVFGKDQKSNAISILGSGEEKVNLNANGQQKFETKEISTTSTAAHTEVAKSSSRGGSSRGKSSRPSVKKVEGSGVKYAGYGVQVKQGAKVLGESFTGDSFKQHVGGTGSAHPK